MAAERQGPKSGVAPDSSAPASAPVSGPSAGPSAGPSSRPPSEPPDSRRTTTRYSCIQFLWYCSLEDSTKHGLARTVDASENGLGLLTANPIAAGERLFVVVVTRFGRVALVGRVMHVEEPEPGSYRAGVHIDIIPPVDRSTWYRTLREVGQ